MTNNYSQDRHDAAGQPPHYLPTPDEVRTKHKERSASVLPAIIAVLVVLLILAAMIVVGIYLFKHPPTTAVIRDIFIILLGIQSIIISLLVVALLVVVVYVALKMYDLTQFVQNELRPILGRADDMVRTVHSRTVFISDTAVKPVIEVMSVTSAVKSIFRSLFG
jgi:hypothetical protein